MIEIKLSILGNKTRAEALGVTQPGTGIAYVETEASGARALDALIVALSKHHAGQAWAVIDPPGLKGTIPNGATKRRPAARRNRRML